MSDTTRGHHQGRGEGEARTNRERGPAAIDPPPPAAAPKPRGATLWSRCRFVPVGGVEESTVGVRTRFERLTIEPQCGIVSDSYVASRAPVLWRGYNVYSAV